MRVESSKKLPPLLYVPVARALPRDTHRMLPNAPLHACVPHPFVARYIYRRGQPAPAYSHVGLDKSARLSMQHHVANAVKFTINEVELIAEAGGPVKFASASRHGTNDSMLSCQGTCDSTKYSPAGTPPRAYDLPQRSIMGMSMGQAGSGERPNSADSRRKGLFGRLRK